MSERSSPLQPVFLRAWTEPAGGWKRTSLGPERRRRPIESVLVVDTETTVDPAQRLLFGSPRYCRLHRHDGGVTVELCDEWLFYPGDLAAWYPDGFDTLHTYAADHGLTLLSQREFLDRVLWRALFLNEFTGVGFNLGFDLSRLAYGRERCTLRGEGGIFLGGFTFRLWGRYEEGRWVDEPHHGKIVARKLGPGRVVMAITRPSELDRPPHRGQFLDLHTLDAALSGKRRRLESACEKWGLPPEFSKGKPKQHGKITADYIDYNRQDVTATAHLCAALLTEFERHTSLGVQATKVFSAASMVKAHLQAMRVEHPLFLWPDTPEHRAVRDGSMHAYHGGLVEVRVRGVPAPVVPVDFLSMYPTVCVLLGVWDLLTAERIDIADCTTEVQVLLDRVAAEGPGVLQDPAVWRGLVGFGWVRPDGIDQLPVRTTYERDDHQRLQLGVQPFETDCPIPYALADLVASTVYTTKAPKVERAVRLVPVGWQEGLRSIRLRGQLPFDPYRDDFFRTVIELRKDPTARAHLPEGEQERLDRFLKVLANSLYGILVELDRQDLPGKRTRKITVHALDHTFPADVRAVEKPGAYSLPPLAAPITAAARLMLALADRVWTDMGGTFQASDTDALLLVATQEGGPVAPGVVALTWDDVERLQAWFEPLHPYHRDKVPAPLLQVEKVNFAPDGSRRQVFGYAISPKRHILYTLDEDNEITVHKVTEGGLGQLLDPTAQPDADPDAVHSEDRGERAWIRQVGGNIIRRALGLPERDLPWLDKPAVTRLALSTPNLLDQLGHLNANLPYEEAVKPFGFALTASPDPRAPAALGRDRIRLIAPYDKDPDHWDQMDWTDIATGDRCRISTDPAVADIICEYPMARDPDDPEPELIPVRTYRQIVNTWATNPVAKAVGPDGQPCRRDTVGPLTRRPVRTARTLIRYVGKEGHGIDEYEAGAVERDDVLTLYQDNQRTWNTPFLPALHRIGAERVAELTGLHGRTIQRILAGKQQPRPDHQQALEAVVIREAQTQLRKEGHPVPKDRLATLQAFLDAWQQAGKRRCPHCGQMFRPRRSDAIYCSDTCRKGAWRAGRTE